MPVVRFIIDEWPGQRLALCFTDVVHAVILIQDFIQSRVDYFLLIAVKV